MCFSIRARHAPAGLGGEQLERAAHERVVGEAVDVDLASAGSTSIAVGEVDALENGRDLVVAVVACRPDDEREVDLRCRRRAAHSARASATNSSGSSASARVSGSRPIARERGFGALARRDAAERERVRQRLPPVRERRLDDALHVRPVGRAAACVGTRRAPSRRSGAAGRPRGAPDGSRCARPRAARARRPRRTPSCAARRRSGRRPRAAPSRTSARRSAARRGSRRRSASRRCTGRFATSLRGCGSSAARSSASASPQCSSTFSRRRQLGLERAVDLDGVHVRDALGEEAREDAAARARSRARRRRVRAPRGARSRARMFSSTRKCWPSSFFGAALTGRSSARRSRRSARRARPRRRCARARARRPCGRRSRARSAGRGAAPARGTGESVSASRRSAGTAYAAERRSCAFLYVTLPANETYQPRSSAGSSSGSDEKQCSTTVPSKPASAASVSSSAARVWMTTGLPSSAASCELLRRRRAAARRAARSRGSSRGPSRPRRRPSGARARRAARRRRRPPASCGWMPSAATTPSWRSAIASVSRQRRLVVPTETMRVDAGLARALDERRPPGLAHASRCAWVSITPRGGRQLDAREERRRRLDPVGGDGRAACESARARGRRRLAERREDARRALRAGTARARRRSRVSPSARL